jgi:hypothetical protein
VRFATTADTTQHGLEDLIVRVMTGRTGVLAPPHVAADASAEEADA